MKIIHERQADINKRYNEVKDINVSQGDKKSNYIEMTLFNENFPLNMEDKEVSINYELPNKEILTQTTANGVSTKGNKVIVKIENKAIEVSGRISYELHIRKDKQLAILGSFVIASRAILK